MKHIINRAELQHTAELAMLKLSEHDLKLLEAEISALLDYCAIVQSVDVTAMEATTHSTRETHVLRKDEVGVAENTQALVQNAQEHDDEFIVVPSVF